MKVRVIRVIAPLTVGEFDEPQEPKNRFVGVQILLQNVGEKTYSDAPSNGATLITAKDEEADATIVSGGACTAGGGDVKISSGAKRRLCIPFEVRGKQKLKTFQFGLESGFGPQTGEWSLR